MAFNSRDTALARRLHWLTTREVRDLAARAGTTYVQINRWASGARPSPLYARSLAQALDTTVDELFPEGA